ncbi:MAG: tetratricopeptide repeat protein, partial [Gammaproteobacteria bacterium]
MPACTFVLIACAVLSSAIGVNAQEGARLSATTHKALSKIHRLIDIQKNPQALAELQALMPAVAGNAYDAAVVQQTLGYVYNNLGQQQQAAEAFKQALRQNALPSDVVHQLHYNLVQVLIASNAYEEGLAYFDRWLSREPSPGVEGLKLAAAAYYQAKQCKKAIPYLRQLLAQREKPEEQWQQVLLACYYESSQYLEAARLLEQIVGHDPHEKRYWRQLAAAYQQAGEDMRALAALTLAYEQGLLDSQTTMELV